MVGIDSVPAGLCEDPGHRDSQAKQRTQNRHHRTWRKRLFRWYHCGVQDFHAGDLFGFLDFCRFVLFRQELKDGRLNFCLQKQIRIRHAENRQSADRWIKGIFFF